MGAIAIGMLGGAVATHVAMPDAPVKAFLVRIGVVLSATWLALPQLERIPNWMLAGLAGGLLLVVVQPRSIFVVVPGLALLWSLRGLGRLFGGL